MNEAYHPVYDLPGKKMRRTPRRRLKTTKDGFRLQRSPSFANVPDRDSRWPKGKGALQKETAIAVCAKKRV